MFCGPQESKFEQEYDLVRAMQSDQLSKQVYAPIDCNPE